jgi:hypothetical protein
LIKIFLLISFYIDVLQDLNILFTIFFLPLKYYLHIYVISTLLIGERILVVGNILKNIGIKKIDNLK